MKVASFFSGAGGLDLGFQQAGFDVVYANEFDKTIWDTYERNHTGTYLDKRSIVDISPDDVPDVDGIIGGPPCQSWSEAGAKRGADDPRGKLFFNFIHILESKQPKFFLAENVRGLLAPRNRRALEGILKLFDSAGFDVYWELLDTYNHSVPQDRKRVIFIGFRKDLCVDYEFPESVGERVTLKDAIYDLKSSAVPAVNKTKPNSSATVANHEYQTGDFSSMFMSRNRVRSWDEPSFTIQASGRHAPLHPSSPKMVKIGKDKFSFVNGAEYRRLSVRECARLQCFPDSFEFHYKDLSVGYKMVGNAVPVHFARRMAVSISSTLQVV